MIAGYETKFEENWNKRIERNDTDIWRKIVEETNDHKGCRSRGYLDRHIYPKISCIHLKLIYIQTCFVRLIKIET